MKITKLFIGIFSLTFFLGVTAYFLIPSMENQFEGKGVVKVTEQETPNPKTEVGNEPEILEENNHWDNEDESEFEIKLQEIGKGFHGDQVEAKSGETWLGLFKDREGFYLKKSKVKIRRVHDPIIDDEETKKTGKSVSVLGEKQPIYLLKNANTLKEGKVETFFGGNPNGNEIKENVDYISIEAGFSKGFKAGNSKYSLKAKKGINKKGEKIIALILENEELTQTLHSIKDFDDGDYIATLYWLGDLDEDGKPDFFLSPWIKENISEANLYLSSKAQKGKLVKLVATYSTSGC